MTVLRTAIIGGGIAGLAAAFELEQARASGLPVGYTLYESRERLGGALSSEKIDGILMERGPDSFLTEKPAAAQLCRELGLDADLIGSNDAARKTFILVKNRLVALPDGLMFLVPTQLIPTALTRLFSLKTKIRMGLELLHTPRPSQDDESVAALVERHFGQEAVERLADPLLSGIYGGDASQLSARTVLPRLVEMEREYGSLTRGMLATRKKMRAKAKETSRNGAPHGVESRVPRSIFTSLRGGMQQLVDALVARLDGESICTSTPVRGLHPDGNGWRVESAGESKIFDAVILAAPAWAAGALLRSADPSLSDELAEIPYSSSITVNLAFDEAQLGMLPDGFGFLVPVVEQRAMLACTFVHRKFLGRIPTGKAVLRAFLGGVQNEALLNEPDDVLLTTVRRELKEILGIEAAPEHVQVSRWPRAMAQYAVGHQERAKRIAERVAALPGLRLAGNAYDGIGVSDCIRLGRRAAQELAATAAELIHSSG